MSIEKQTKDILRNAIKNFALENEVGNKQSQILIFTEDIEECIPRYKVLKDNKAIKEVSFNELLNVKIDFLGREMIATPFMAKTIRRLSMEQNITPDQVKVLIWSKGESDVSIYFFANKEPIKEITFDYIFEGV